MTINRQLSHIDPPKQRTPETAQAVDPYYDDPGGLRSRDLRIKRAVSSLLGSAALCTPTIDVCELDATPLQPSDGGCIEPAAKSPTADKQRHKRSALAKVRRQRAAEFMSLLALCGLLTPKTKRFRRLKSASPPPQRPVARGLEQ
jgi:hypothetical protein